MASVIKFEELYCFSDF